MYILIFLILLALIPLINFLVATGGLIGVVVEKFRMKELFIETNLRNEDYIKIIIFIVMLPYHIILSALITAAAAIPAAIIFPFMIIPSYYLNIKRYFEIMSYWWKGNRFQGNVDVEKMVPDVKARI